MARQFDIFRTARGAHVVREQWLTILQSDLLDELRTRVVAPLLPAASLPRGIGTLNPAIMIDGQDYRIAPQLMATLTTTELGSKVDTAASQRDLIVRAVDALLSGI